MRPHPILPVVCGLVCSLESRAQTLVRAINGPAAGAQFGRACCVVLDQNADGFADVLVGAPGFNQDRGALHCVSGAFLSSGTGASILWSVIPAANPGDRFGTAAASVGDVTGDGIEDFLVGMPGFDQGLVDVGAVSLIDGSSHALVATSFDTSKGAGLGSVILAIDDITGDGKRDVAVRGSGSTTHVTAARVWGVSATSLPSSGAVTTSNCLFSIFGIAGYDFGAALAGGCDLDGDGDVELLIGSPNFDFAGAGSGRVALLSVSANGFSTPISFVDGAADEHLGASLAASEDYDGDGVVDVLAGAPHALDGSGLQAGRVLMLSGAKLLAASPPYDIGSLTSGFGSTLFDQHFGTAVCASHDLNGDGVGEILVGAPDYTTLGSGGQFFTKGLLTIFSGATRTRWGSIGGGNTDRLGDALAGAVGDLDGDGFEEFVAGGSLSDAGGTDSGVLKCYRLFPVAPSIYCTGKVNSLGCTPSMDFSGSPSTSSAAPFLVTASSFVNQKNGLLFYSHAPSAAPFQGGTKCAASPTLRTPPQNSGGATSGQSCSGTYSFDFNARIQSGIDASLVAGCEVYAQYWSRDPLSASHTSLSNAVRFLVDP